jgi:hypothetical protein
MQSVSHLSSLVFSLPLDETISAQVWRITILLNFYWLLQLDPDGFHLYLHSWGVLDVLQDCTT